MFLNARGNHFWGFFFARTGIFMIEKLKKGLHSVQIDENVIQVWNCRHHVHLLYDVIQLHLGFHEPKIEEKKPSALLVPEILWSLPSNSFDVMPIELIWQQTVNKLFTWTCRWYRWSLTSRACLETLFAFPGFCTHAFRTVRSSASEMFRPILQPEIARGIKMQATAMYEYARVCVLSFVCCSLTSGSSSTIFKMFSRSSSVIVLRLVTGSSSLLPARFLLRSSFLTFSV